MGQKTPKAPPRRASDAKSLQKASKNDSKMEPFCAKVCFRKTAFGLRLCVFFTHRHLPKTSPGHSQNASARKIHQNPFQNRLWGGLWGPRLGIWVPRLPKGSPKGARREGQMIPKSTKFLKKSALDPQGGPGHPGGTQKTAFSCFRLPFCRVLGKFW